MSKHIVILSGSPRKNGNSARLAESFLDGARASGKETRLFNTAEMRIGGCLACGHCFKHQGVCVQRDDMMPILDALGRAEALALVSPVYFFSLTAQIKAAIDRLFALLRVGTPVKRAALLLTCGNPSAEAADPSIGMFRHICAYQKWEEAGIITAAGLHDPGEIEGRGELELAKKLGESL